MSKTRQKQHSELEHLRGQIKKLKSENRQLRKRLKELDKKAHFYEHIVDEVAEEVEVKKSCPSCGKGSLQEYDFTYIIVTKCDLEGCGYQRKRKPRGKTKAK